MSPARSVPPAWTAVADPVARPLRSILALADFSPKSDNAVARATLLAREHGATLHLLHVVAATPVRRRDAPQAGARPLSWRSNAPARRSATLASRNARSHGVSAMCSVRAGDTLHVILEEAQDADLVIVAAKGSIRCVTSCCAPRPSGCSGCCSGRC